MSLTITRPTIPVPLPLSRGGLEATTAAGGRAMLELGDLALLTAPGGTATFLRADKTWAAPPAGGGGSTTLLGLTDVPDTYTGQASKVLAVRADETGTEFVTPAAGGSYTDEQAQDAVGAMLADTVTIALAYADATPALTASVRDSSITEAKLSLSDVTTRDASTTAHGLLCKLSGTATQYLDGSGAWTTPAGGGETLWTRTPGGTPSYMTGMLAWWRLEEASGNRVESISAQALVPQGTVAQITNAAGKTGQALKLNGTAGTYLSLADNATMSAGASSFTIACWLRWDAAPSGALGFVGKGNANVTLNAAEYMLAASGTTLRFIVGSNAANTILSYTGLTVVAGTWYFVVGWYDAALDIQYLQVNDGTVVEVANAAGSHDSTLAFEVGRYPGSAAIPTFNGCLDNIMFAKRIWTAQERTDLWNSGNGVEYGAWGQSSLTPTTATDRLLLATASITQERLEVDGAIKVGTSTGTTDGTLRWTGTDFEGRKAGAWVSMTGAGGYTDEQAQDAVGAMLVDTATIDLTYTDATPSLTAAVIAGSIGTTQLTNDAVTYAKLQNVTDARLLGRSAGSAGDAQEITVGSGLSLSAGALTSTGQPLDALLTALAALTTANDQTLYFTGPDAPALATFTAAGRTLVGAADAAAQRTALALGTMATQNSDAVAITGGTAVLMSGVTPALHLADGNGPPVYGLLGRVTYGTSKWNLFCDGTAPNFLAGTTQIGGSAPATTDFVSALIVRHPKDGINGILVRPFNTDTGLPAVLFQTVGGVNIGSITTTATATAFNTSSDVRLKHGIAPLTGALDVVQALRPVKFRWNSTDQNDIGFLAHELMVPVPTAVTGQPDEVNDDGSIRPQQVDNSKLVPILVAAIKDLLARVETLEQRLA